MSPPKNFQNCYMQSLIAKAMVSERTGKQGCDILLQFDKEVMDRKHLNMMTAFTKLKEWLPGQLAEAGITLKPTEDIIRWDMEGCVVRLGHDALEKAQAFVAQFKPKETSAKPDRSL